MIYFLCGLLIIHGIICLLGAFIPVYPPVFFFYAFFPGPFIIKLIIVLLAGAAQLTYGVYLSLRQKRQIRWYWPAIVTIVMTGLLLVFPAVQNPNLFTGLSWGGENRQSIPPKAISISLPILAEGAPDDIIPAADGPEYRANSEVGIENGLVPIESRGIVLPGNKYSPGVTYRDYIAAKAGESRNNIFRIDTGGREIDKLSLYTVDKPDEIEVTEGMRWQRVDEAAVVLTIEVPADVEPGQYVFQISVRINGVDCGAVPCTLVVIDPAIAGLKSSSVYHSQEAYLTTTLPNGWAAVEGTEYLAHPFEGQVAFNSWGEEEFWAREVRTEYAGETTYTYGPQTVMSQVPEGGAYVALVRIWGPPRLDDYAPPEYTLEDLSGLCQPHDWRQDSATDAQFIQFYKWGRDLRLEIACRPDASDETVNELNILLASWRFDSVPAGDTEWMGIQARKLLPEEVEPLKFSNRAGSRSREGVHRITDVEIRGDVMIFRFTYQWDNSSHWWTVEVSSIGETTLTGEGGEPLP